MGEMVLIVMLPQDQILIIQFAGDRTIAELEGFVAQEYVRVYGKPCTVANDLRIQKCISVDFALTNRKRRHDYIENDEDLAIPSSHHVFADLSKALQVGNIFKNMEQVYVVSNDNQQALAKDAVTNNLTGENTTLRRKKNAIAPAELKNPAVGVNVREADIEKQTWNVEGNTFILSGLSKRLSAFTDAKLDDMCISSTISPCPITLPYPNEKLGKLFVRKCYVDIFDLFVNNIEHQYFGISGTPGIGKSLFFVYILYRLVHTESPFKPKRIVYHTATIFRVFDFETFTVSSINALGVATKLVEDSDTFYIVDGKDPSPIYSSSCVTMYIASPRSRNYKEFVKQTVAQQWILPVWTLEELEACRTRCYPDITNDTLNEQYRIYGGAARSVFRFEGSTDMEACMNDADAIRSVRNFGHPTQIFETAHMLLHVIVSDDGNYKFKHVDIASKYVGEQLWKNHAAQMVTNLSEMFGGSPNEVSRHLFEIYGHRVFSQGGRTLKCRNLQDNSISDLCLIPLDGKRESFTRNSIPKKPITHYYEPSDDDSFPAIDSLSPQGMFQFTVGNEHPIRGVLTLQQVCDAFDTPYKLYFVVPPHRFEKFGMQPYKGTKGSGSVNPIKDLEQYVLELAIV